MGKACGRWWREAGEVAGARPQKTMVNILDLEVQKWSSITGICDVPDCMEVSERACSFLNGNYTFISSGSQ